MSLYLLLLLPMSGLGQEFASPPQPAEDSAPPQPEGDQALKQMEFMTNVACYLLLQRRLSLEEPVVQSLQSSERGQLSIQKVISNLFKICKEEVPQELKIKAISAKSKEEMDDLELGPLEYYDLHHVVNNPPSSLTPEEEKIFKFVEGVEAEIRKLRRKNSQNSGQGSPEDPQSPSDDPELDSDDSEEDYREAGQVKATSIAGFDINEINGIWLVAPAIVMVFGGVFFFWYKLFLRETKAKKQKKKN